jgi:hypothetical protein
MKRNRIEDIREKCHFVRHKAKVEEYQIGNPNPVERA